MVWYVGYLFFFCICNHPLVHCYRSLPCHHAISMLNDIQQPQHWIHLRSHALHFNIHFVHRWWFSTAPIHLHLLVTIVHRSFISIRTPPPVSLSLAKLTTCASVRDRRPKEGKLSARAMETYIKTIWPSKQHQLVGASPPRNTQRFGGRTIIASLFST